MYLSEEVAALCLQASREADPHKLLELTRQINELLEKQETHQKQKANAA
jgi:hypothetical protein